MSTHPAIQLAPEIRWRATVVAVMGVPLIFLRFVNDPFNVPKLALLLGAVSVAGSALVVERLQGLGDVPDRRILVIAAALAGPLILATILSPYRFWALFGEYRRFQGLIPYLLVISLGILIACSSRGKTERLAYLFVLASALAGGYATLQYFGIDLFVWENQFGGETADITSTLGNANFAGGFFAIALPVALSLWYLDLRDYRLGFMTALIAAGLIVSFSQGGWVAAIGGVAVAVGFVLRSRWKPAGYVALFAAATIAIGSAAYVVNGIVSSPGQVPTTVSLRSWWWQAAWGAGMEHPIFGHGPNAFAVDFWSHRPPTESVTQGFDTTDDPHSVYLALFVGAGVLGTAGLLFVLGWSSLIALRSPPDDVLVAGLVGGIAAYAIQAVASIDQLVLRAALWTCIGILVARTSPIRSVSKKSHKSRSRKSSNRRAPSPIKRPVLVTVVTITGAALFVYAGVIVAADGAVLAGQKAYARGNLDKVRSSFDSAIGLRGDYQYRHTYGFLAGNLAIALEKRDEAEVMLEEAKKAFGYLDGFPNLNGLFDRARILRDYAATYGTSLQDAADSYEQALSLDPYNYTLAPEAATTLLAAQRFEAIVRYLAEPIELLEQRAPQIWPMLGIAYFETGDVSAAESALTQALALVPDDPRTIELQEKLGEGNL